MKKFLTATVVLALLLISLCGCGSRKNEDDIHNYNKSGQYDPDNKVPPTASGDDLITPSTKEPSGTPTPTPAPVRYKIVLDPGHGGKDPGAGFGGGVGGGRDL